eukprot:COSAG05_NODE_4747_length_1387_cov_3.580081_3_plen_113_part_01
MLARTRQMVYPKPQQGTAGKASTRSSSSTSTSSSRRDLPAFGAVGDETDIGGQLGADNCVDFVQGGVDLRRGFEPEALLGHELRQEQRSVGECSASLLPAQKTRRDNERRRRR